MDRLIDEVNVYKTVAGMNGRIPFRYNTAEDHMEFFFANDEMVGYGSTMNNYVHMLCNQRDMAKHKEVKVDDLIACLSDSEKESMTCEARLSFRGKEPKWYRVAAVRQFNNGKTYLVGELTDISSEKTDADFGDSTGQRDPLTGLMSKSALKSRFADQCAAMNGQEGAFLDVLVDGYRSHSEEVREHLIINVALCLRRQFAIDAYVGRNKNNEFYVVYFGKNPRDTVMGLVEELKSSVAAIQGAEFGGKPITISCGIYFGAFNVQEDYDIREKAHMALLTAKRKGGGATVVYSEDEHEEYNGADAVDATFVQEVLENSLEKMSSGVPISEVIAYCFNAVGEKYGLDRIFVHELNEKTKAFSNSYNWYTAKYPYVEGIVQRNRLMEYSVLAEIYETNTIIAVSDAEKYNGNAEFMNQIRTKGLKSFVRCVFDGGHGIKGCVGFECYVGRHEWSEGELRVFKIISQLISSYLLNIREYENMITKTADNDMHDPVTGLIKYDHFLIEAEKCVQSKAVGQCAVVYLGFMDFMSVNSRYGYDAGNMLLKGLAAFFDQIKDRVIIASRINADNFVALVNTYDSRGSAISPALITTFGNVFDEKYGKECPGVDISFNAGIAIVKDSEHSIEHYVKKAYEAKGLARNMGSDVVIAE